MSNKSDRYGPTADQRSRLSYLERPQFNRLLRLLGRNPQDFPPDAAPVRLVDLFADECERASIWPLKIEVGLRWLLELDLDLLDCALKKLSLDVFGDQRDVETLTRIARKAELNGTSVAILLATIEQAREDSVAGAGTFKPKKSQASVNKKVLELITGAENTLLPIHFIERAAHAARGVAKVLLADGTSGTGFVVSGNRLVTNAHVLPDVASAAGAQVLFNYQKNEKGLDREPLVVALLAETLAISPVSEHDLAVVTLAEPAAERWVELPVGDTKVEVNERVCIIQHPGGQQKHLGIYHNFVIDVDDKVVQYLTDTLPGSSGSPVFNEQWQLVAVHHAGGSNDVSSGKEWLYYNEGICVKHLVDLLGRS